MSRNIIAILRGVTPDAVTEIGTALVEAGIDTIEVPLNSPQPLHSIAALAAHLEGRAQIGAGTVLRPRMWMPCRTPAAASSSRPIVTRQ